MSLARSPARDRRGRTHQDGVAGGAAVAGVDGAEGVDVDRADRQLAVVPPRAGDLGVEAAGERVQRREARQWIAELAALELLLELDDPPQCFVEPALVVGGLELS